MGESGAPPGQVAKLTRQHRYIAAWPLSELEQRFGLRVDTLLIDCEGCVEYSVEYNLGLLDQVHTVLLEGDMGIYSKKEAPDCGSKCVNYDLVMQRFQAEGFKIMEAFTRKEGCCPWIYYFALKRE